MNFGDAIGYLKLDASMSQERAIEIVKEHEWMRDLDIPNFVPYPSSRQVWETAKRQVEGGKFFTACVLRMVEEGKCAMERKSHMDRVRLWDENHKKEQAAALQAPTGSCHNCAHLYQVAFNSYTCRYPLPRAVLSIREWQTVDPGESTIRNCRVWRPKP